MRYLYQFVGWILKVSYEFISNINPADSGPVSNYAYAIILMSVIIKLITLPLSLKQQESMAKSRALQTKVKELQEKYGNDMQTIARKQQELYKEAGVSQMGGCLPLLIQMPILFAMFAVVRDPNLYVFTEPGYYDSINKAFFWMANIADKDKTMIIPILSGLVSFASQKLIMASQPRPSTGDKEKDKAMKQSNDMMTLMMPLMFVFVYRNLPAVIPLYMIINQGLQTIQQLIINKIFLKKVEGESK
ncbi:MAG: YidC/Oxa1 family membrane protein insertase [Bacillota bacterium]|nr:YidC/Oxa1 family membrane protein insertase [Bacillota bacterium]